MDSVPKIDRVALKAKLMEEVERTIQAVADAVDNAPAGRIIRDSEEPARIALDRFRQLAYEAAIQAKTNAAEADFSPSARSHDRPKTTA